MAWPSWHTRVVNVFFKRTRMRKDSESMRGTGFERVWKAVGFNFEKGR